MARNDDTYLKLYDLVRQRLGKAGQSMPVSREAFDLAAEMPPGLFDVARVAQADNYTFYQVAHLCLLFALPRERDYEVWRDFFETMSPAQFRTRTLRFILNRCSVCNREARIVNGEEYIAT